MAVYDINGNIIGSKKSIHDEFAENMKFYYECDYTTGVNYTVIRVFKTKIDGTKQYPFVYCPNGTGARTQSVIGMNQTKNFCLAINAGIADIDGQYNPSRRNGPIGMTIENSTVIVDNQGYYPILTIDNKGDLSYSSGESTGEELVQNGIVSACVGVGDAVIVKNFVASGTGFGTEPAQRQIIGQFGNGDYGILTCEGRGYNNSDGWTTSEAQSICLKWGLKFAYNLDGGGSVQTCIGKKLVNLVYEGTNGRLVATYIVFNGTDTFGVPLD